MLTVRLSAAWLKDERSQIRTDDVPTDPEGFSRWFADTMDRHPAPDHPVYEFLEHKATLRGFRYFIAQECTVDAEFADLIAMTQLGAEPSWKLEMAHNYWDEMGAGDPSKNHAAHFSRAAELMELPSGGQMSLLSGALACGSMLTLLAMNRCLNIQSIGALAATELAVPRRFTQVARGGRRLGVPAAVVDYYAMHVEGAEKHAEGWMTNVVAPLIRKSPRHASALAEGVLLRLNTSLAYCDGLLHGLQVREAAPRASSRPLERACA
jgi:hypothetical protein